MTRAGPPVPSVRITAVPGGSEFSVKVVPRASRTRVLGLWNEALRVAVAAPPHGGQANAALLKHLAAELKLAPGRMSIVGGHSQPLKRVRVAGLTPQELAQALAGLLRP